MFEDVMWLRVYERLAISMVFFLAAFVCFLLLLRKNQTIKASLQGFALTAYLSTPLFVLVAIIGFSWVSYSNPISLSQYSSVSPSLPNTSATKVETEIQSFIGLGGSRSPLAANIQLAFENYAISRPSDVGMFSAEESMRMLQIGLKLTAINTVRPFSPIFTPSEDGFNQWEANINDEYAKISS
jgi:hypothetical protein